MAGMSRRAPDHLPDAAVRGREGRRSRSARTEAFGFTELAVYEGEDGTVLHAELAYGNGAVMLGIEGPRRPLRRGDEGRGPARGVRRRGRRRRTPPARRGRTGRRS